MADPRGRKRPPPTAAQRKSRRLEETRRKLEDLAIMRRDAERAEFEKDLPNKMPLPNEIWELIMQFTDLKTAEQFALASRDARAKALFSDVKAVSDAIRDVPLLVLPDKPNRHNNMLIQNVLFVIGIFVDETQLLRIITEAFPNHALLWPELVRWTVPLDEDEAIMDVLEDSMRDRNDEIVSDDHVSKMIDRLVALPGEPEGNRGGELAVMQEIKNELDITMERVDVSWEEFDAPENFKNKAEFKKWRGDRRRALRKRNNAIDAAKIAIISGQWGVEGDLSHVVPFLIKPADLSDPDMKQLRRVVGFLWQAIPTNKIRQAKRVILGTIGEYRVLIMQLHLHDDSEVRDRMVHAGSSRFGGPDEDLLNRVEGNFDSVVTRTGATGTSNYFIENQLPLPLYPTFGLTPAILLKPLGELARGPDGGFLDAQVVKGRLRQSMVWNIRWWKRNVGDYWFYYRDLQGNVDSQEDDVAIAVHHRPFDNLAEYINMYAFQSRGHDQRIADMAYTTRLRTWYQFVLVAILNVIPDLSPVDLAPALAAEARLTAHPGPFAFYDGVRQLAKDLRKSHWKNALLRNK